MAVEIIPRYIRETESTLFCKNRSAHYQYMKIVGLYFGVVPTTDVVVAAGVVFLEIDETEIICSS